MGKFITIVVFTWALCLANSARHVHGQEGDGLIFERPFQERSDLSIDRPHKLMPKVLKNIEDYRQADVWNIINEMDTYKSNDRIYNRSGTDRPLLSSFHYLVVPSYWSHQDINDATLIMNTDRINNVMDDAVEYFKDMSWGQFTITYQILNQATITTTKNLYGAKNRVERVVKNQGFVLGQDYDGIIFLFWKSSSALNWAGGFANVNGNFIWVTYDVASYRLLRHEIGHNLGHEHHSRNHYLYRETRPLILTNQVYVADGLDMMSGGNGYEVSDFDISSKWFFNWAKDSSIINMQPEGQTPECPTCVSSGTFTIKPMDMRSQPGANDVLGIHIPIATKYDTTHKSTYLYSYWLSYRSGVNGKATGLLIHYTFYQLYDSMVGAYTDSLLYYAKGYSEAKVDAALTSGKCYHVSPTSYMKDQDLLAAESVQPRICVNSIDIGNSLQVAVSFPSSNELQESYLLQNIPTTTHSIQCGSSATTKSLDSSKQNLLLVTGTGMDGKVSFKMCNPNINSRAIFFDDYPYSPLDIGSHSSYGSMKIKKAQKGCVIGTESSMIYQSEYDSTYILVPSSGTSGQTTVEISCSTSKCANNQYKLNGKCIRCPDENPRSNAGSNSITKCFSCPSGTSLPHPLASVCTLSDDFLPVSKSTGWRIWAPVYHTVSDDRWGVQKLEFYSSQDCSGTPFSAIGQPVDSNNNGSGPELAFTNTGSWVGMQDNEDTIWVGMIFSENIFVQCVKVQNTSFSVKEIRVQALVNNQWRNVWVEKGLTLSSNNELILSFDHPPTASPTAAPTKDPTASPTRNPTSTPTIPVPTNNCVQVNKKKFLLKVTSNNIVRLKTCQWLGKKSAKKIRRICKKRQSFQDYLPAVEVCPITCGTCSSLSDLPTNAPLQAPSIVQTKTASPTANPIKLPTSSCIDKSGKFYFGYRTGSNGEFTVLRKSCSWLETKSTMKQEYYCSLDGRFGVPSARERCLKTCKVC